MLYGFNELEVEVIEHHIHIKIHHCIQAEDGLSLNLETDMPRKNVSYRPVRYYTRKKNTGVTRLKEQLNDKISNSRGSENLKQPTDVANISGSVVHPYPINNILVLPKHSEALINIISRREEDFSFKKILKKIKGQKRKEKQRLKKMQKGDVDLKPDISKIKLKKPPMNKHIIILSDSDSDDNSTLLSGSEKAYGKKVNTKTTKKKNKLAKPSLDDDVILIETLSDNEVIDVDDSSLEPLKNFKTTSGNWVDVDESVERNDLLSTPESSTSNDFLENPNASSNSKFNFVLHGSEFKDSEFLKPTVPVDVSESGSISSVSDVSGCMKAAVFNVVDFPKEKENLFEENNLENFRNSITPVRKSKKNNHEYSDELSSLTIDSRDIRKKLPTLSDIDGEESKQKRTRGRSIIRELVNDRAYELLSSAQEKTKRKKRRSRQNDSDSLTEDNETTGDISDDSTRKKKRKKVKKTDSSTAEIMEVSSEHNENYSVANNLLSSTPVKYDIIENRKFKKKKESFEGDNACIQEQTTKLAVRSDLFSETEHDVSVHNKKSKKKKKYESVDNESSKDMIEKRKAKRLEEYAGESSIDSGDPCRKRKKGKSSTEVCATEDHETNSDKLSRKKKVTDNTSNHENESTNIIGLSETNCDKNNDNRLHKRPKQPIESDQNDETIVDEGLKNKSKKKNLFDETISIHNDTIEMMRKDNINVENTEGGQHNLLCNSEVQKSDNSQANLENDKPDNFENHPEILVNDFIIKYEEDDIMHINLNDNQQSKETDPPTEEPPRSILQENITNISLEVISAELTDNNTVQPTKSDSIWKMCSGSAKFFSSSQSLFKVSNVQGGVLFQDPSDNTDCDENTQKIDCYQNTLEVTCDSAINGPNSLERPIDSVDSVNVNTTIVEEPISDSQSAELPLSTSDKEDMSSPVNLMSTKSSETEIATLSSENGLNSTPENNHKNESKNNLKEKDMNLSSLPEMSISSEGCDSNKLDDSQSKEQDQNSQVSNIMQIESSLPCDHVNEPLCSVSAIIKTQDDTILTSSANLPAIIEEIVKNDNGIDSMKKLCDFLEEEGDPKDILKKVSLIKQAFLAKSSKAEVVLSELIDDASSDSSIICIEEETPIILIEDDPTTPNSELNEVLPDHDVDFTAKANIVAENVSIHYATSNTRKSESQVLHQKAAKKIENITNQNGEEFDVEALQKTMSDDPNLWRISSEDLPNNKPQPRGKRCIKCRQMGHLGYKCPNNSNLPRCFLCGTEGHLDFKCPKKICTKCGRPSSVMTSVCTYCKHYSSITCSICKHKGHPKIKCPDLWRRYHLTVVQGPPIRDDGMKLKPKENWWCSSCGKNGHLEHFCYIAQRNRTFQALDPTIYNYTDIYNTPSMNSSGIQTSEGSVISEQVLDRLQQELDSPSKTDSSKRRDQNNVENTKKSLKNDINVTKENAALSNFLPLSSEKDVSSNPSMNSSVLSSSNNDTELLPGFVVVDEVCSTPKNQRRENNKRKDSTTPNFRENEQNIPKSHLNETQRTCEERSDSTYKVEKLRYFQTVEMGNRNYPGLPDCSLRTNSIGITGSPDNINFDPNSMNYNDSIQYLFMTANPAALKDFICGELELLASCKGKVKSLYFQLRFYEEDNQLPVNRRRISSEKKQSFYKKLNMLLFGKEQLKGGAVHFKKLSLFAKRYNPCLTDDMRESLYRSYDYIFRQSKHNDMKYSRAMNSLMKHYGRDKIIY